MNRDEFKQMAVKIYDNSKLGNSVMADTESFWSPEYRDGWKASVFAVTKCMPCMSSFGYRKSFWGWCTKNLSRVPMCFMSDIDNNIEWWGFNTEEDATLFLMRWQ
jgi:hypothetical protein